MNKLSLINYFTTDNNSGYKTKENHIKNKFNGLLEDINLFNKNFGEIPFTQKLYNFLYEIDKPPKCRVCNKTLKWRNRFSEGYSVVCNRMCMKGDQQRIDNIKKTNIEKYGVDSISKIDSIKEKKKNTYIKKYGVENIFKSDEIKDKIKKTNLERYGIEFPIQSKKIKDKIKSNNIKKYGVTNPSKLPKVKNKLIETNIEKYGFKSVMQVPEIKNKNIKTKTSKTIIEYKKILGDDIDIIYDGSFIHVKNSCKIHNQYLISRSLFYHRVIKQNIKNPCIICNPIQKNTSIKENELKHFIEEELKIQIIKNTRKLIGGFELDIFIETHQVAFEFNGLYWHSELNKESNYHLIKTELANSVGIKLYHIFENEWIYKSDIVKSMIKAKLGIINNRIFGRKCTIKEISSKESSSFLIENHIQGNINSSIRIGLFYNNELVSLMTFGKMRKSMGSISKNNEYEMYRFCNKLNTTVIGGASKLLKYFIKKYSPKKITTYADRRYGTGNLYQTLNFEFKKTTKPNYWYFKEHEYDLYHRFNFRKDVLIKEGFDSNKTEHQIMLENGYLRIYDCGNIKYEMTF